MIGEMYLIVMLALLVCGLLSGYPVALVLSGVALIVAFLGYVLGDFPLQFLLFLPERIFGFMTNEVFFSIPLFILMGSILQHSGCAERFLLSFASLFRSSSTGMGVSVIFVGALLAASTGIVGATVVAMGLVSMPAMLRQNYHPRLASGIIVASGSLGQIIPPSIMLLILSEVISHAYQEARTGGIDTTITFQEVLVISPGGLFAGAIIPSLLLVGLYIAYVLCVPLFSNVEKQSMGKNSVAPVHTFRLGDFLPLLLIGSVLGSILGGVATPAEASSIGVVGAILIAAGRRDDAYQWLCFLGFGSIMAMFFVGWMIDLRLNQLVFTAWEVVGIGLALLLLVFSSLCVIVALIRSWQSGLMQESSRTTVRFTGMIFLIFVGSAFFTVVLKGLGGDVILQEFLTQIPGGFWGALLFVMLVIFVMGFFLEFIEIALVVLPLVSVPLLQMGADPVWLAMLWTLNLLTSFLTPPFGFALFYLRGVVPKEISTKDIYQGALPFVGLQILALALLMIFPSLVTWLPKVLNF